MIYTDGRYLDNSQKTDEISTETVLTKMLKEKTNDYFAAMEYNAVHWMTALYANDFNQIQNLSENGFPYLLCFTSLEDFTKELIITCEQTWLPGAKFTYEIISPKLIEISTDQNPNKVLVLSMNQPSYPGQCRLYTDAMYVYVYFD